MLELTIDKIDSMSDDEVANTAVQYNKDAVREHAVHVEHNKKEFEAWMDVLRNNLSPKRRARAVEFISNLGYDFDTVTFTDICPSANIEEFTIETAEQYRNEFANVNKIYAETRVYYKETVEDSRAFLKAVYAPGGENK